MTVILTPGSATLAQLHDIWSQGKPAALIESSHAGILAAAAMVAKAAAGENAVYGINTGFGKLASVKIAPKDVATLQRNLILSHCCGVGEPLDVATTRLMMVLKLLSLGRGASGVVMSTVKIIEDMLAKGVTPVIPRQGSVGASGDLAPLAHMAAAMIGEGEAMFEGVRMSAADALQKAGLTPIILGAKEGLALINGTQFIAAYALKGFVRLSNCLDTADIIGAMSLEALKGSMKPFDAELHQIRPYQGNIYVADRLEKLVHGSEIINSHQMANSWPSELAIQ